MPTTGVKGREESYQWGISLSISTKSSKKDGEPSQAALWPTVEILEADANPAQFHDNIGPVAKWIRRRFPTPEIAGSSPARVDQNFSTKSLFIYNILQ